MVQGTEEKEVTAYAHRWGEKLAEQFDRIQSGELSVEEWAQLQRETTMGPGERARGWEEREKRRKALLDGGETA